MTLARGDEIALMGEGNLLGIMFIAVVGPSGNGKSGGTSESILSLHFLRLYSRKDTRVTIISTDVTINRAMGNTVAMRIVLLSPSVDEELLVVGNGLFLKLVNKEDTGDVVMVAILLFDKEEEEDTWVVTEEAIALLEENDKEDSIDEDGSVMAILLFDKEEEEGTWVVTEEAIALIEENDKEDSIDEDGSVMVVEEDIVTDDDDDVICEILTESLTDEVTAMHRNAK